MPEMSIDVRPAEPQECDQLDSSERLMRLLDSVRLEKVPVEQDIPVDLLQVIGCTQCGSKAAWNGAPWCPDCEYLPKLGRKATAAEKKAWLTSARPVQKTSLGRLCLASVLVVLLGSLGLALCRPTFIDWLLYWRAVFLAGLASFLCGHVLACRAAPKIHLLWTAVVLHPAKVWAGALRNDPASRLFPVLGSGGLIAVILSVSMLGFHPEGIVGQLNWRNLSRQMNSLQILQQAYATFVVAPTARPAGASLGASLGASASPAASESDRQEYSVWKLNSDPLPGQTEELGAAEDGEPLPVDPDAESIRPALKNVTPRDSSEFVIFGYLTNSTGEIRSVLLAGMENSRPYFVGKLSLDDLDEETLTLLQQRLSEIRTARALLPSPYRARWVRPIVACQVAHSGWTNEGLLREGVALGYRDLPSEDSPDDRTDTREAVR
jgi:hypothetical protein